MLLENLQEVFRLVSAPDYNAPSCFPVFKWIKASGLDDTELLERSIVVSAWFLILSKTSKREDELLAAGETNVYRNGSFGLKGPKSYYEDYSVDFKI
jgi:hypothetical protein